MRQITIICFLVFLLGCQTKREDTLSNKTLFVSIDSFKTGITFKNVLTPSEKLNIIDYVYFYNGGGVATADFNNDGLEDLFFVSNQKTNELYLNTGGLAFKNITEASGVSGNADWNTGVTTADINGDGFIDIYVCGVSKFNDLKSTNELYINNGDLTFTESASDYGLDFKTYATQASFFDYDHDGDLDCYLLNYALQESENYVPIHKGRRIDEESGDYLLRNDGGTFVDVTNDSGIMKSKIGFGLSISIADVNNDGWEDIYIANDFHEDDYFYVNQKDGTFLEQGRDYFKHFSRFSMGSDIADINNDGFMDIINLDMYPEQREIEKMSVGEDPFDIYSYKLSYGYYPQYAKNSLQLNNAGKSFSEIASYSGVAATDWSWSSLFADFDNDGIKDLFVSNGIPKRANDLDYINFVLNYQKRDPSKINLQEYYDEAIGQMPDGSYHDFVYKGTDSLKFIDKSAEWGFNKPTISTGTVYSDLDNDGDLDIVINRLNSSAGIYENKTNSLYGNNYLQVTLMTDSDNTYGIGSRVEIYCNKNKQVQQLINTRGFQSAVGNTLHFGVGNNEIVDSLKVFWNTGEVQVKKMVKVNRKIKITKSDSSIKPSGTKKESNHKIFKEIESPIAYKHVENAFNDFAREPLMPFKISSEGPALAIGDVNNDGLDDVYVGGARNQIGELWVQSKNGNFNRKIQSSFEEDTILEQVDAQFIDVNLDRYLDLYVVVAGNEFFGEMANQQDVLYINDGKGNFTKENNRLPKMLTNTSCVRSADFDGDGDIDLFVGGRVVSKSYGLMPHSYLLLNDGKGYFTDVTLQKAPNLQYKGMITDAFWEDVDNDEDIDLLIVGEWMSPQLFKNDGTGNFVNTNATETPFSGLWHSVSANDFDGDGDVDFIAGNLGTNTKFYRNGIEDLCMFVKDFDSNGSVEQIVTYREKNKWFPIEGRDALGKPLPGIIKRRFSTHKDFANKSIAEIFTKEELENTLELKVNTLQTRYFQNNGKGVFTSSQLPKEVNYSTVFSVNSITNNKAKSDAILLSGNYCSVNTWQTPYDASYGVTLTLSENNEFENVEDSGFYIDGEVRSVKQITINKKNYIVAAVNNGPLRFFEIINKN